VQSSSQQAGTSGTADPSQLTPLDLPAAEPPPLPATHTPAPATGRYIPLFWRVLALNAALVTTMAVAIAIVLPAPFAHIAADDAIILAVTLLITLVANTLLLRGALAPLTRLPALLRRVDPLRSGERLQLARAYNQMLDQLETERLQSTRRALSAQEGERLRVAQELHDEVGQALTGILLGLSRVSRQAPPELATPLKQMLETTRSSIDDVRRIAERLRPEPLEHLGLTGALMSLSRRLGESSDLHIECHVPTHLAPQPPDRELVIYRVAQEATTNAIRHAHPSAIDIMLQAHHHHLTLAVRDDGRGMRASRHEGGGIRGMRERASLVGGALHVESAPNVGTEVRLVIPLDGDTT
jgi:two-component system, NarL family, sensor histidine kinase UhpB